MIFYLKEQKVKISLLGGTGAFAEGLVIRWARAGHDIFIGSRSEEKAQGITNKMLEKAKSVGINANITGLVNADAVKQTEVVVVCLPHEHTGATLQGIRDSFANQIVISPVVPMKKEGEFFLFDPPPLGSAVAGIKAALPSTVKIVSAYHNIPAKGLANFERVLDYDVVICGDDEESKAVVKQLTEEMPNLRAIDAGPLQLSGMIEAITPLIINMNIKHKHEFSIKFV